MNAYGVLVPSAASESPERTGVVFTAYHASVFSAFLPLPLVRLSARSAALRSLDAVVNETIKAMLSASVHSCLEEDSRRSHSLVADDVHS